MKLFAIFCVMGALTVPLWAESPNADEMDAMKKNEPPAVVHWARGEAHGARGGGGSPNLISHGGPVLNSVTVQAIFWGASWGNDAFVGDKIGGLDTFYFEIGGTSYAQTNVSSVAGRSSPGARSRNRSR